MKTSTAALADERRSFQRYCAPAFFCEACYTLAFSQLLVSRMRTSMSRHTAIAKPSRRAFTLVELLVVIGIIALLISILLPTLSRANDAAKRVKCMSQMRELTMAWTAYAMDFKGWLVDPNTGTNT